MAYILIGIIILCNLGTIVFWIMTIAAKQADQRMEQLKENKDEQHTW